MISRLPSTTSSASSIFTRYLSRRQGNSLRANILSLANVLLASGLDPAQSIIFVQSDVREHTELCWLLGSVTQYGELRRMTQFKDKAGGKDERVSAALLFYPVLQAADILLYDTNRVPVGEDQKQHIELTRDIGARFNARYGETFVLPEPDIKTAGARVMSLEDPTRKMSKSDANPNAAIALTDDADTIRRKIRRAVTDSGSEVLAAPDKPALTNLLTIYSLLSGEPIPAIESPLRRKGVWRLQERSCRGRGFVACADSGAARRVERRPGGRTGRPHRWRGTRSHARGRQDDRSARPHGSRSRLTAGRVDEERSASERRAPGSGSRRRCTRCRPATSERRVRTSDTPDRG